MSCGRDTRKNVRWQEAKREPVRGVKNDRLVGSQAEPGGGRCRRSHCARDVCHAFCHGDR
jgi:hypothetical protein